MCAALLHADMPAGGANGQHQDDPHSTIAGARHDLCTPAEAERGTVGGILVQEGIGDVIADALTAVVRAQVGSYPPCPALGTMKQSDVEHLHDQDGDENDPDLVVGPTSDDWAVALAAMELLQVWMHTWRISSRYSDFQQI
jgi:hypothetical protein